MKARDALKLHPGDEVIDNKTGEPIRVICVFEEPGVVMIEGTAKHSGYNHWTHRQVK